MAETEKLIDLVRERPYLYDMNDPEYKNRSKRLATWKEIASEMGSGNVDIWFSKWKGLKDNFVKFKKSSEPAHADTYKNYKNWLWAEKLMFLDDCLSSRRLPQYRPKPREPHGSQQETLSNFELDMPPAEKIPNSNFSIDQTNKSEQGEQESSDDGQENDSIKNNNENTTIDGVEHFFLSYAEAFKKLPIRMQIMLKLDIATLFSRYELQADGVSPESIDNIPRVVPHPVKREFDLTNMIDE